MAPQYTSSERIFSLFPIFVWTFACLFFFNVGYQCESMNVCVAVGGVGANHVLITGRHPCRRGAVCLAAAAAGSSASPSAPVTVIKTSRCAAVSSH